MSEEYIAALLREREGYVRFGHKDRVKAVDAELARVGYRDAEPVEQAVVEVPEKAVVRRNRRSK